MNDNKLTSATVALAKQELDGVNFVDDDLLLFERFEDVPLPKEPRRINCLFVALCLEGNARYMVDTIEYQAKKNDVIIINAGHVTNNYYLSDDCRGIAIMCSNSFFQEIIKEIHEVSTLFLFAQSHPMFHIKDQTAQTFLEYFYLIQQKVKDTCHRFRRELVVERRVNWYANQMNITPKYLSESVKQVSKRPPNDWIDRFVTMEMRVLLKNSTLSIKEIADRLHFPNQSFMGKYFKEHVGMSPMKYRKEG